MHAHTIIKIASLVALLGAAAPAAAAGTGAGADAASLQDVSVLQQKIRRLEEENRDLRQRMPVPPASAPLDVKHADERGEDLRFFDLGVDRDYLESERARIVDQIQQFIPPLYEPVLPLHAYTLPPGAMRMKISTQIFNNFGDFGSDDSYAFFFDDVQVRNVVVAYDFFYGFELPTALGRDLVLNINVPYKRTNVRGTGHPFNIEPFVLSMEGDAEGPGDVSVTLKKKWLDQGNAHVNVASFLGVVTPTGKHRETFNKSQTFTVGGQPMPAPPVNVFGENPDDLFLPNGSQPGTGAWGFRVGGALTRQFTRSALHAGAMATFFTDNTDDITPGNELRFGLSYVVPPLDADWLSVDLSIFGRHKDSEEFPGLLMHPQRDSDTGGPITNPDGSVKMFTTEKPRFRHGTALFVSPSLIFTPIPQARIIVSPAFRIRQPRQGPSPDFQLTTSMEFTF